MYIRRIMAGALCACLLGGTMVSCSDDLTPDNPKGDGTVSFSVNLEAKPGTRAASNYELNVTTVTYGVYDESGNLLIKDKATVADNSAAIELKLVPGKTYDIAFFAQNTQSNAPYYINWTTHTLSVDYSNMNGGNGNMDYCANNDIFHTVVKGYEGGSSTQETVTLTRPTAQINIGSNDLKADAVQHVYSTIYTSISTKAYSKLNLITGEVEEEVEINLPYKRVYLSGNNNMGTFPITGYEYASTLYVLVPKTQTLVDVTFNVANSRNATTPMQSVEIPNAPVQRNYRTNIYGSLLTDPTNWKISLDKQYVGGENIWLGDVTLPTEVDGVYTITTPAELAGIAKLVNDGDNMAGKTVKLAADLDLNNRPWTPIGNSSIIFAGTFDGDGHTISNLKLVSGKDNTGLGLFGYFGSNARPLPEIREFTIDGATVNSLGVAANGTNNGTAVVVGDIFPNGIVKNVTVRNADIKSYRWSGGIAGRAYGNIEGCNVENIKIESSFQNLGTEWDNADKAGAICGMSCEGGYYLRNNRASNVEITGYRHVGGMFGLINFGYESSRKVVDNNYVQGGVVTQILTHNYNGIAAGSLIGEVTGEKNASCMTYSNNNASGVRVVYPKTVTDVETLVTELQKGGSINIGGDITIPSGSITLTENTVIDLGNYTVTIPGGALRVGNGVKLTIDGQDGVVTSDGFTICGDPNSTIVVNDGTIRSTSAQHSNAVNTNGHFIMNGGTVENTANNSDALTLNWANESESKYAEINGGTVITHNNYALNIFGGSQSVRHKAVINGGTFMGTSCVRFEGNVDGTVNGGYFIKTSTSTGHPLCTGATTYYSKYCKVTVNGGYYYDGSNASNSICRAGESQLIVNGAYMNRTTGGFTIGNGHSLLTLDPAASITLDGVTYSFPYQVK